ncbi:hypothetical protein KIPB_004033 [Kipferlia bialata]|uniref:Uncharacterized protein n=1 Tax=Kipferlia bialata TaxID=797122 RepID=A0A9K3CT53_9EUKA|nr:hypothetical protein KIPB_004033 [Kipferlia bialata]|eukprot:g4033.t1
MPPSSVHRVLLREEDGLEVDCDTVQSLTQTEDPRTSRLIVTCVATPDAPAAFEGMPLPFPLALPETGPVPTLSVGVSKTHPALLSLAASPRFYHSALVRCGCVVIMAGCKESAVLTLMDIADRLAELVDPAYPVVNRPCALVVLPHPRLRSGDTPSLVTVSPEVGRAFSSIFTEYPTPSAIQGVLRGVPADAVDASGLTPSNDDGSTPSSPSRPWPTSLSACLQGMEVVLATPLFSPAVEGADAYSVFLPPHAISDLPPTLPPALALSVLSPAADKAITDYKEALLSIPLPTGVASLMAIHQEALHSMLDGLPFSECAECMPYEEGGEGSEYVLFHIRGIVERALREVACADSPITAPFWCAREGDMSGRPQTPFLAITTGRRSILHQTVKPSRGGGAASLSSLVHIAASVPAPNTLLGQCLEANLQKSKEVCESAYKDGAEVLVSTSQSAASLDDLYAVGNRVTSRFSARASGPACGTYETRLKQAYLRAERDVMARLLQQAQEDREGLSSLVQRVAAEVATLRAREEEREEEQVKLRRRLSEVEGTLSVAGGGGGGGGGGDESFEPYVNGALAELRQCVLELARTVQDQGQRSATDAQTISSQFDSIRTALSSLDNTVHDPVEMQMLASPTLTQTVEEDPVLRSEMSAVVHDLRDMAERQTQSEASARERRDKIESLRAHVLRVAGMLSRMTKQTVLIPEERRHQGGVVVWDGHNWTMHSPEMVERERERVRREQRERRNSTGRRHPEDISRTQSSMGIESVPVCVVSTPRTAPKHRAKH